MFNCNGETIYGPLTANLRVLDCGKLTRERAMLDFKESFIDPLDFNSEEDENIIKGSFDKMKFA